MAHPVTSDHRIWIMCLAVTLCGCTGARQISLDVITLGKAVDIRSPYTHLKFYDAQCEEIFSRLIAALEKRGAQILVANRQDGLICWCEAGISFVAMPTQLPQHPGTTITGLSPGLAMWHGIVHGTARLRTNGQGTWLYLHIAGWEPRAPKGVFSDGSYERNIFASIGRAGGEGSALPSAMDCLKAGTEPAQSKVGFIPPLRSCFPHLGNLADHSAKAIRDRGLRKIYPVPQRELWTGCLDVISQYSAIVSSKEDAGTIIFMQGLTLPKDSSGREQEPINVLLMLYTEPSGPDGSAVYIGMLPDDDPAIRPIVDLSKKMEQDKLEVLKKKPVELAAALVADRLFEHLTTQLFYKERWQDKLIRRDSGSKGAR